MSRPRIRTLKPEFWADERVGTLSRDARLALVGLLTMADDEGRLRALPAGILGHAYPYDLDAPELLDGWLGEVSATGIVVAYEHREKPYIAFKNWRRHQYIQRPTPSLLPPPPSTKIARANAVDAPPPQGSSSRNAHGALRERSSASRASADRIGSEGNGVPPQPPASGGSRRDRARFAEQAKRARAVEILPNAKPAEAVGLVELAESCGARTAEEIRACVRGRLRRPDLVDSGAGRT